jgi:hypothetical protein
MILLCDLRELYDLLILKTGLCMFQLAPVMTYTHKCQLYGSYGADKMCVFLHLVTKMNYEFLEQ